MFTTPLIRFRLAALRRLAILLLGIFGLSLIPLLPLAFAAGWSAKFLWACSAVLGLSVAPTIPFWMLIARQHVLKRQALAEAHPEWVARVGTTRWYGNTHAIWLVADMSRDVLVERMTVELSKVEAVRREEDELILVEGLTECRVRFVDCGPHTSIALSVSRGRELFDRDGRALRMYMAALEALDRAAAIAPRTAASHCSAAVGS